jgi:hypothetical protein
MKIVFDEKYSERGIDLQEYYPIHPVAAHFGRAHSE